MYFFNRKPLEVSNLSRPPLRSRLGVWPVVVFGIVALLATAAALQYRWTIGSSTADEMRITADLESLMVRWHSDLFGEFSAICTAIQVGPDLGARDTWNDYLERYLEWNNALPHESLPFVYRNPDLVGEIYIYETAKQTSPHLFWLNLKTRRIQPYKAPPEFATLLPRLEANSASLSKALRAWQTPGQSNKDSGTSGFPSAMIATSTGNTTIGWQFDENIPAIVHPIFHHGLQKSLNSQSAVDWIIITLDMSVLQQRVLPMLSARYFAGIHGLDYRVAVVRSGARPSTIYSSDPDFGFAQLKSADSSMNIFGFWSDPASDPFTRPVRHSSSLRITEWHNFAGPAWFPVIEYGPKPDSWLLALQYRGTPLQSAISKVKWNNFAISALVLLLLAVSIAMVTVAGYRAHHFAQLQMDFVASVSHEIRTPLAAIFSAGENIEDGLIRNRSDLKSYGAIVTSQSRRLMNHVDRILLYASIRSGKDRYNLRPLEVPHILNCIRKNLSVLLAEEACVLEQEVQPGLPPVLGDMFAVSGCLENLITNAIKYSRADRHVHIMSALVSEPGVGQEVTISVQDHGIGIANSELKHIFEPFYRCPEVTAAQIQGTGLGLSLAKHLAEAMGGRIEVASRVGAGSTFTLHLRVAQESNPDHSTVFQIACSGVGE